MATCSTIQNIAASECIGDSLTKINNNFANLNNDTCNLFTIVNNANSFKNKLINAQGLINQRVYVSGTATTTSNQYTVDRWRVVVSGQNLIFSTSQNIVTFTAPAGGVEQVIEGQNIESGTYVLSWTGTATATINGTSITNSGTILLTGGSDVTVKFTNGTFSLPQLEKNTAATLFEYRPIGLEFDLCKRYYEKGYDLNVAPQTTDTTVPYDSALYRYHVYGARNPANTYDYRFSITFQIEKRIVPTVTTYSPYSGAAGRFFLYASPVTDILGVTSITNTKGFHTTGKNSSIYANAYIQWVADAEIY